MPTIAKNSTECVLFDWDGTLLDSFEADAQAYSHMFNALGLTWSMALLKQHYSPNWHACYRAAGIPRAKWDEADRFVEALLPEASAGAAAGRATGVAHARAALHARAGVERKPHARPAATARTRCRGDVSRKVCSEDAPRRKPHPARCGMALDRLGVCTKRMRVCWRRSGRY